MRRTRFAPSPTGPLHLGHALAALTAFDLADPGEFLVRIEDLDRSRSRPDWERQIFEDLHWLGLSWPQPVLRQSERREVYAAALSRLEAMGVTYRCVCRRADIRAALSAPQEGAPANGPDGLVYPGTCRGGTQGDVVRLDIRKALDRLGAMPAFREDGSPELHVLDEKWATGSCGDIVLSRSSGDAAYHLAVVVDDAAQGVTIVSRGEDLFEATFVQILLQDLLELPRPLYHHHPLVRDAAGRRLAKRDDAKAIARYRSEGMRPDDVRRLAAAQASGCRISTSEPSRTAL